MKNKKLLFLGGGAAIILVAIAAFLIPGRDPVRKKFEELESKTSKYTPSESVLESIKMKDAGDGHLTYDGELTFDQTVALLRKKYGAKINHPLVQMRMLQELLRYLQKKYPSNWVEYLHELLGAAFPELAQKLFTMSKNLYLYDKFLNDTRDKATKMGDGDRDKFLWSKRYELFGSDADEIWAGEKKYNDVKTALNDIANNRTGTIKEKLSQFKDTLNKTYGDTLPSVMESRRQNLLDGFVGAVQTDLQSMTPADRREAMHDIRSSMGMDDAAITRWDALDAERDQRWSNGQIYTNERKQIISQYTGTDREQKLDDLRHKLFGDEADTIKSEEASGYFRFDGKQQYGIN